MAFGVILLLDSEISGELISYSAEIGSVSYPYMVLGEAAPPHVTLLHADCSQDVAQRWWSHVNKDVESTIAVLRAGLIFEAIPVGDRYVPNGGVSVGVEIIRST